MKILILVLFLTLSNAAYAGWFDSSPSKNFTNLKIRNPVDAGLPTVTIHQLDKLYKKQSNSSNTWRKIDAQWVLDIEYNQVLQKGIQKVTVKRLMSIAFKELPENNMVIPTIVMINGESIDSIDFDRLLTAYNSACSLLGIEELE